MHHVVFFWLPSNQRDVDRKLLDKDWKTWVTKQPQRKLSTHKFSNFNIIHISLSLSNAQCMNVSESLLCLYFVSFFPYQAIQMLSPLIHTCGDAHRHKQNIPAATNCVWQGKCNLLSFQKKKQHASHSPDWCISALCIKHSNRPRQAFIEPIYFKADSLK